MTALRWILGLIILVFGGGMLALFIFSNGFRRSFGSSENSPFLVVGPLVAVGILFAGLVFPASRALLHLGAITALGLGAFCVWQMISESASVLWFGILYLLLWLFFYWRTAGPVPSVVGPVP